MSAPPTGGGGPAGRLQALMQRRQQQQRATAGATPGAAPVAGAPGGPMSRPASGASSPHPGGQARASPVSTGPKMVGPAGAAPMAARASPSPVPMPARASLSLVQAGPMMARQSPAPMGARASPSPTPMMRTSPIPQHAGQQQQQTSRGGPMTGPSPRASPVPRPVGSTPAVVAQAVPVAAAPQIGGPVGRGRAMLLARARPAEAKPLEVITEGRETTNFGRGRGVAVQRGAQVQPQLAAAQPRARMQDDDTMSMMSFRSEEFETSSRIGGVIGPRPSMTSPPMDAKELVHKLQKLETSSSKSPSPTGQQQVTSSFRTAAGITATSAGTSVVGSKKTSPTSPPTGGTARSPEGLGLGPNHYRGQGGKPIELTANYLRLTVDEGCGIFEYEVLFEPSVDSRDERYSAVNQHRQTLGTAKSFDGNKLYVPKKLPNHTTMLKSVHSKSGADLKVTFRYKRELIPGESETIYLYNVIFHKIMRTLQYAQHTRKGSFFDPKAAHDIKQYKLTVWPGYITAVDVFEGGLQLQLDVAHRVLRTETVLDVLQDLRKKGSKNLKEDGEKALLGCSVITRYNNKTYKIDGLEFGENPTSKFTLSSGQTVSFADYYKRQYGVEIKDMGQPLLINRPKIKGVSEAATERLIKLVPELCIMTGLTDAMRADFRIMKEVGGFTRQSPAQRQAAILNFVKRVRENPDAHAHLTDWGLKLASDTVKLMGRVMEPETICFGKNYREVVNNKADWGRAATTKNVLTPVPLTKWAIFFTARDENVAKQFCQILQQQGPRMGIPVSGPRAVKLANDRTDTYLKEMRAIIDPSVQLVVTIFPQMKSDRYAAVKKLCCLEMPIASQVINSKTISNEKRLTSVVQKVALQINCKLGGELWACATPFKDLMVVGIDVYHDNTSKVGSIAGVVTSMNDVSSRYYSSTVEQKSGQEIMDALRVAFIEGLIKYWETNHKWPANIVVFRDGVGDGQLEVTEQHEAAQFTGVFRHPKGAPMNKGASADSITAQSKLDDLLPPTYRPGFSFVVVQKRINTRILAGIRKGPKVELANPPPGTVLDHSVTRYKYKDFFLVPQVVNQGTVSPTHFIVLKDLEGNQSPKLGPTEIQKLAYKLTHMYFNWPGTVRVPAPVQYAHKLVDLVGQHVHKIPARQLNSKLFYL